MGLRTYLINKGFGIKHFVKSRNKKVSSAAFSALVEKIKLSEVSPKQLKHYPREVIFKALKEVMGLGIFNNIVLSLSRVEEIISHPLCPPELIAALIEERTSSRTRMNDLFYKIASNPNLPQNILRNLFEEKGRIVARDIPEEFLSFIEHPLIPKDIFEKALLLRALFFPEQVISYPKTPLHIIAEIINTKCKNNDDNSVNLTLALKFINLRPKSEWAEILKFIDPTIKEILTLL